MMKHFLFTLTMAIAATSFAQVDTAQVNYNRKLDKKPRMDILLVDLNADRLVGWLGTGVEQKWHGRGINVSLLFDQPLQRNGQASFAVGAGFTSHNYYTNALVQKIDSLNVAAFQAQPETLRERGKISVNYVDVPVEFRFRTLEDKHGFRWKLALGARVGYLIDVHEKMIDGQGFKFKAYHYPQVAKFRYGPTFRFGYGAVMLTGYYSLSTFFQTGKGLHDLNTMSLGITISPF